MYIFVIVAIVPFVVSYVCVNFQIARVWVLGSAFMCNTSL